MKSNGTSRPASVLVVDDNLRNLQVLGGLLQKDGIDVEFALDGNTALDWLTKKTFDLVLLDIMMPVMDGYQVCSAMKKNPSTMDIPVIFITARIDTESIVKGFETGAVDYITKPFIPPELLARVRSQLEIKKSRENILLYLREIEDRNRSLKDSIEYASNIQNAVLDTSAAKFSCWPDNFIIFLPKDIVSGDFYWSCKINDIIVLAVMDCTGHGVPGALMSILGITLLNEIVIHEAILQPDQILESLRKKLIDALGQDHNRMRIKDAIEGSVISYNTQNKILLYSGSFNPLYYIHNHEINLIKADRIPIGYYEKSDQFTLKTVNVEKNDIIYLFSDGYFDQFGSPESRKIMSKNFMDLVLKNHNLPMISQKTELISFLNHWKGDQEQTDDILVVGIKF
jgi:CheY-like chemotaxis protein